jgi:hypothetical protein
MFPATAPWMMTSNTGIVITPNSDATSSAGSLFVELLAIAAPSTPSQIMGMNVPSADAQYTLLSVSSRRVNRE